MCVASRKAHKQNKKKHRNQESQINFYIFAKPEHERPQQYNEYKSHHRKFSLSEAFMPFEYAICQRKTPSAIRCGKQIPEIGA